MQGKVFEELALSPNACRALRKLTEIARDKVEPTDVILVDDGFGS